MFKSMGTRMQKCPPTDYMQLARDMGFTTQQVPHVTACLMSGSCAAVVGKTGMLGRCSPCETRVGVR